MPAKGLVGELIEIRTLISHPMETGYRRNQYGAKIARHIIERFSVDYLDENVFSASFGPGVAANPYLSFFLKLRKSGDVTMTWRDDRGKVWQHRQRIIVS